MFNCELCSRTVGPCIPQHRVVVEKRLKAKGWETAKELAVCLSCRESLEKEEKAANGN